MAEEDDKYDLAKRTEDFAVQIIEFAKKLPDDSHARPIKEQLVRAGTSIGANYAEADCAESKNDFRHKMGVGAKEARETKYWLKVVKRTFSGLENEADDLHTESDELYRIFVTIRNNTDTGNS